MAVHLCTYATTDFYHGVLALGVMGRFYGADKFHFFSSYDLSTEFKQKYHQVFLNKQRGDGYWCWKPYIILETMKKAKKDDIIIYCDSGVLLVAPLKPIVELAEKQDIVLFQVHPQEHFLSDYAKRDLFVLLDADSPKYWNASILMGGFAAFKKNTHTIDFLNEWLLNLHDERVVTDIPNQMGLNNLDGFKAHRHDQPLLTVLAIKKSLKVFPPPNQYNHRYPTDTKPLGKIIITHPKIRLKCREIHYRNIFIKIKPIYYLFVFMKSYGAKFIRCIINLFYII